MKKWMKVLAVSTMITLVACSGNEATPRKIDPNKDRCGVCDMSVADNVFATQLVTEKDRYFTYDDIGCLFKAKETGSRFVKDYQTSKWLEVENAFYVYAKKIQSPMGYSVAAFEKEADAKKVAESMGGKLMTFKDLTSFTWPQMKMSKEHMDEHKKMEMKDHEKNDKEHSDK